MNIEEKTKIEEKRKHPFLFLLALCALVLILFYFLQSWQERMKNTQLENIMRSDDIDILLNNSNALNIIFQAENSEVVDQVLALEDEIKTMYPQKNKKTEQTQNAENSLNLSNNLDPVDLALRNIIVLQGEHGEESWRLKADWATLRQSSSLLSMSKPTLLYTPNKSEHKRQEAILPVLEGTEKDPQNSKNDFASNTKNVPNIFSLYEQDRKDSNINIVKNSFERNTPDLIAIQSDRGIVIENSKIFLKDNVIAKQNQSSIKGQNLNFDDATKIATFPTISYFEGENLTGNANTLNWHLEDNKIYGTGDVQMVWTPQS